MNNVEYRHILANRLLEITTDLRLLDKSIILMIDPGEVEKLGKTIKEATQMLEDIQRKNMVVAKMIENKRNRHKSNQSFNRSQ